GKASPPEGLVGEIKGVEPDQRRNHEGYQHDRFPANADAVATSRREFSWGTRPAEACLSRPTIPRGAARSSEVRGHRHETPHLAAAIIASRACAATAANGRPT